MPPQPRLTLEDVVGGLYRGILGRDPDPDGLAHYTGRLAAGDTIADILAGFIHSDEFRARQPATLLPQVNLQPALPIALKLSRTDLARLWTHIAANWTELGQQDPFWSVISTPNFRIDKMADAAALETFYASGRNDLDMLDAWCARNDITLPRDSVFAEYGCGVGRATALLAERCATLSAFDISASHLARARQHLAQTGHHNVTYHHVQRPADLKHLAGADLFFSFIVLQHNPPPIIHTILETAFHHLAPGGIAFFQVPTYKPGYGFTLADYLHTIGSPTNIEMHCLPQSTIFTLAAQHGLHPLEIQQDNLAQTPWTSHSFMLRKASR